MQVFANQHGMLWGGLDIPGNYDRESQTGWGRNLDLSPIQQTALLRQTALADELMLTTQ